MGQRAEGYMSLKPDEQLSLQQCVADLMQKLGLTEKQAWVMLLDAIGNGELRARGTNTGTGRIEPIPPSYFKRP